MQPNVGAVWPRRRLLIGGRAGKADEQASDADGRGVLVPQQQVCEHGQHLVCDAEHRVASRGDEGAAPPAGERDCDAKEARERIERDAARPPRRRGEAGHLAAGNAESEHDRRGEKVGVEHRPPHRTPPKAGDDLLAARVAQAYGHEVHAAPRIRTKSVHGECVVRGHVASRAGKDAGERDGRPPRRQRAAEETPLEHADKQRPARAEDDERLHVGVCERLQIGVDGGGKERDVE
mmetsp:Transcript_17651/g.57445  ORF Transcript_17651/g.57445 Transcript_17651/m.57445 type:complete len:235 (-) Transcript_17651:312-1016(-)